RASDRERDRPIQALVWDYVDAEANRRWRIQDEPSAELVIKEINGYYVTSPAAVPTAVGLAVATPSAPLLASAAGLVRGAQTSLKTAVPLNSFAELRDDGSTACGAWIYTGIYAGGRNHAADRRGDDWVSLGWGFSWPANRRLMYNRASADVQGNPWPKEARLAREHPQNGRVLR